MVKVFLVRHWENEMNNESDRIIEKLKGNDVQEQIKKIAEACQMVWQQIAGDIPEDDVSSAEMVEISLDANRLDAFGYPEEQKMFEALNTSYGYENVYKEIIKVLPYGRWEAGGSQL